MEQFDSRGDEIKITFDSLPQPMKFGDLLLGDDIICCMMWACFGEHFNNNWVLKDRKYDTSDLYCLSKVIKVISKLGWFDRVVFIHREFGIVNVVIHDVRKIREL